MVSTGQNPARASERLPIIAIRQLGQSTASPAAIKKNDAAATPDGLPPRRPRGVWPTDETILRSRRNRPETEICSNGIGQTTGCDHVGNHHQPILPPVLQGRAVRHSKAASYLGLIVATRSVHPASVEYDCEQAGPPSPGKKSLPRIASGTGFRSENAPGHACILLRAGYGSRSSWTWCRRWCPCRQSRTWHPVFPGMQRRGRFAPCHR
jgi:hypothetical protein